MTTSVQPLIFRASPQQSEIAKLQAGARGRAYVTRATFRVSGRLDAGQLRKRLRELSRKHEILRTTLSVDEGAGTLVQNIHDCTGAELEIIDLTAVNAARIGVVVEGIGSALQEAGLNPWTGPVLRAALARANDHSAFLILATPATHGDIEGLELLAQELLTRNSERTVQYADAAGIFGEMLESPEFAAGRDYWSRILGPECDDEVVPAHAKAESASTLATVAATVQPEIVAALEEFSSKSGCRWRDIILAAWVATRFRLAQSSVCDIGLTLPGRVNEQLRSCLGPVSRHVPYCFDVDAATSFSGLVQAVAEGAAQAAQRQHYFNPAIVPAAKRWPAWSFEFHDARQWRAGGIQLTLETAEDVRELFEIKLSVFRCGNELTLRLAYDNASHDARGMLRLLGRFLAVFKSAVRSPTLVLGRLDLLAEEDRAAAFGLTQNPPAASTPIHIELTANARRWPDRIALPVDGKHISFGLLEKLSNRVAARLKALGVGLEDRVMVQLERSPELICVLLGVLKSGGAYVPLDADCPPARLTFLLRDAAPRIYIGSRGRLPDGSKCRAISVEDCLSGADDEPGAMPAAAPDNLAYLIYTSGSTGEPKAVMVTHGGLANYVAWAIEAYGLGDGAMCPLHTTVAFDLSVTSIFPPLLAGGVIQIVSGDGMDAVRALSETRGHAAVKLTPSHLSLLSELLDESAAAVFTRMLVVGGEAFAETSLKFWRQHAAGTVVVNEYGPTETVVGCAWHIVSADDRWSVGVPIGRPIAGTGLFVLDNEMEPVPIGADGELYVAGAGLARGYRNRPGLTAGRFVPHPFSSLPGARLYRTGDRVRLMQDSSLLYVSRVDDQLKIRGYRVEPGEIEAVLQQHPSVERAVVVARQLGADENALVAYIKETIPVAASDLRQYLGERLPVYMIPAAFVPLTRLPLTANGKVDRKALPEPSAGLPPRRGRKPSGAIETALASAWCELLRVDEITVEDNFFELGGDSILAIRLTAKARQSGLRITPRLVLENATIERLAAVATPVDETATRIETRAERSLTPAQARFFEQSADIDGPAQRVLLEAPASASVQDARRLVRNLLQRHEALRSRFESGGQWRSIVEPLPPLEEWFFEATDEEADSEAYLRSFGSRIDPRKTPILRALWMAGNPVRRARLLLAIHHLAVDGVSWRILLEELELDWRQLKPAPPSSPPGIWAEALKNFSASPAVRNQAWYWLSQNRRRTPLGVDAGLEHEPDTPDSSGFYLTALQTKSLLAETRWRLQEILLAAVVQALQSWTSEPAIQVEMEGHGREELEGTPDVSRTVGWFTSFYPVSLPIMRAEFSLQIAAVQGVLNQVPDRGVSFGALRHLAPDADLAAALKRLPPAEIAFNFLGSFEEVWTEGSSWTVAADQTVCRSGPQLDQQRTFEILASVSQGRLRVDWQFHRRRHRRSTVDELLKTMRELLEGLAGTAQTQVKSTAVRDGELDRLSRVMSPEGLAGIEEVLPATPLQQGILFELLRSPGAGFYLEQYEYELTGASDASVFVNAWRSLIHNHQILRSGFVWEGLARPLLVVFKQVQIGVEEFDWSALPEAEQLRRLARHCEQDRTAQFDLLNPPLMRIAIFRLSPDRWRLLWTHHHLLLDGWSNALLRQEFLDGYFGLSTANAALSTPRLADFLVWLESRDIAASERFWSEYLDGFESPAPVPFAIRGPEPVHAYEEQSMFLTADLTSRLESFSKSCRVTLSTLVAGAWGLLLSRCTDQTEVVFGSVMSLRGAPVPGIERMVGLLVNTVPVRLRISGPVTVSTWLQSLQRELAQVQDHAHVPLTRIQALSPLAPGAPLFESLFTWQNNQAAAQKPAMPGQAGLPIREIAVRERISYSLALVAGAGEQLHLRVMYDAGRLAPDRALNLLERLSLVLSRMLQDLQLGEIHACVPGELDRIQAWNAPAAELDPGPYSHQYVERCAEESPDVIAAVSGDHHVTYGALNRRASLIAGALSEDSVGPGEPVGLFFRRGLAMVESVLGVLKAGAACLPLDPAYPERDRSRVIKAASPRLILTTERDAEELGETSARLIHVDRHDFHPSGPGIEVRGPLSRESTSYFSYASAGQSTVAITALPHRCLANITQWHKQTLSPGARCLQLASFSCDSCLHEFLGVWATGGTLVIMPEELRGDTPALANFIAQQQTGRGIFPPSVIQMFWDLSCREARYLDVMREMICMGGQLPLSPAAVRFFQARPLCGITSLYGPSETQAATVHRLDGNPSHWPAHVPMGAPVCGAQTHILDSCLNPAPIGAPGELYVGGLNLATGYLGQPALTAEKFVPDPFSPAPGRRLYKTGELAAWQPDGVLVYLGRRDNQVKIRGRRVDLTEVQGALNRHPLVAASVVLRVAAGADDKLVAIVVPVESKNAPAEAQVKRSLSATIPTFMIPAVILSVAELPLLWNQAVDRQKLSRLAESVLLARACPSPPRTPAERLMCRIWAAVLGVAEIELQNDFFDLGGHSLTATQLMSRVSRTLRMKLPLQMIFDHPTVEAFLEAASKERGGRRIVERIAETMESLGSESTGRIH